MTARNQRESVEDADLQAELDLWQAVGLKARLWWRDDDAASASAQSRRLIRLAAELRISVAVAVVPGKADQSLARLLATEQCCVWQHGLDHHDFGDGEFGDSRPLEVRVRDALRGQQVMDAVFGVGGWQRVFVPPFHRWSLDFKMLTPLLGYKGISSGHPLMPAVRGIAEVSAQIDVVNWTRAEFAGKSAVRRMLLDELQIRRERLVPAEQPIGFLTHHAVLDGDAWRFLAALFRLLQHHPACEWLAADKLFEREGQGARARAGKTHEADAVTVVVTSCGRQDLLEGTLDSFLEMNTFPVARLIVIEDGDGSRNAALQKKYIDCGFEWLATRTRVGQVKAVDAAYRLVTSKYIFHCEDDWEFLAPGFIEKSLAVLESDERILQVAIRALDDMHGHPLLDHPFVAGDVPYRLLKHGYDAPDGRTWHGFSFNPGLRRVADYHRLGTYGSLDPLAERSSDDLESEISSRYHQQGMFAALLADNDGKGYARHLGLGRRVTPPPLHGMAELALATAEAGQAKMGFGQHCRDLLPSLARAIEARLLALNRNRAQR